MTSRIEHTDVGAYALGLLEEDDRRAFEAHLSSCPSCTAELADLSGVAHALTGMGPVVEEEPAPEEIVDLLNRKKARDLRNRRGTLVIGVAAAITLVAGGVTVGSAIGGGTPSVHAGHDMGPAESFYAMGSPITGTSTAGASGGLVLEDKGWGTHAALMLAGVKGPLECELLAVSTTGERRVMTGWSVPPSGYGVPGSPSPLYMHGGSPFPRGRIDRFEVVTTTGKTLLTFDI
ncbi:zf-HC2 domain-containing protein [Nonomuraea sp. NPDC049152]|uniref:anti-sigma factor family protein n=1 Tax=Nonomuraea sp. NPDC049152 TaxID=3154350 RepID=UPI0033F84626